MRKLGLTLIPLVLLRAADVYALGLGDIELHSALNQPLNAEIKLLSATPAELQGLAVALAPEAAFTNAGVDRLGLLTQLKFNVVQKSDGSHVITVTSSQPVREPFLDFLVEVNWPAGRFVREYTLLLDPAVTENAKEAGKPAPIEAPVVKAKPPVASQTEVSTPETVELLAKNGSGAGSIAKTPRISARQSDGLSYGPTRRTDTLWKIAEEMRADKSVSTSQVMLALLKHNPHAFSADNVNNLMAGYILRLPSADVVRSVSPQQAAGDVAAQYQQWLAVQRGEAAPARATAAAGTDRSPAQESAATGGAQLKLVAPGDTKASAAGGAKAGMPDANDLASLRKELALALETAEAGRQENQELRERLTMLEQQIATMQRLMNLKSEDLAALQNKATAQVPGAAVSPTPSTQSPAVAKPAAKPQPAKAPPQPEEPVATDVVGEIMSNPQQLGLIAGGFVLISALLWAMVRRRRAAALEAAESMFSRTPSPSPSASPSAQDVSNVPAAVAEEAGASEPVAVSAKSHAHAIHAEEGVIDPIAEADVYLAYKRYEQAEVLIKEAMRHDPRRHELALKLLEIYHAAKNRDAFETQAEALYAGLGGEDHPMWHKVVEMGRQICPDHPLFARLSSAGAVAAGVVLAGAGAAMASDVKDSGDALPDRQPAHPSDVPGDLGSDFAAPGDADPLRAVDLDKEERQAASSDNLIDFEFGLDRQSTDAIALGNNEVAASLDNSLDFDLSLSGAIDNLNEAVKGDSVADTAAMAEEPGVFQLDDRTLAGLEDISATFATEAQPEVALDDIAPTSGEPVTGTAPEFSYDFAQTKDIAGHGEVVDLSMADEGVSSLGAGDWDLESLASSFDGTAPEQAPAQESEDDIFAGIDMVGTKLDLAKAYIDMEDKDGARMLLNEVLEEGNASQKQEAQGLMAQLA